MATSPVRISARLRGVINHVTEAQEHTCSALNGTTWDPKTLPAETADKAAIVAALKASFDECDKAYGALSDGQVMQVLTLGPVKRSRIGLARGQCIPRQRAVCDAGALSTTEGSGPAKQREVS